MKRNLTFHGNVLNGETQDDGPDHTQDHFQVTIHNFCRPHKNLEPHAIVLNEATRKALECRLRLCHKVHGGVVLVQEQIYE